MVFSSVIFLFLFLPLTFLSWLIAPRLLRSYLLLGTSLLFYFWGSPQHLGVIFGSIIMNYLVGRWIGGVKGSFSRHSALSTGIGLNLLILGYFKYAAFFLDSIKPMATALGLHYSVLSVALPLGISFFTFQALSYLIDVYRGDSEAETNIFHLGLYIALFPQLIAGPIVRYDDVRQAIKRSTTSVDLLSSGILRFTWGLGKKVIIANTMGELADQVFGIPSEELSSGAAACGALAYFFQIYFDFSAYSDMAIGLGNMFGFSFPENFAYPYSSRSIKEFWRRWHISLSTWFRDYLYIPLGGNQVSQIKVYRNLLIVFLLCGLWHGASWNFVLWGLFHGAFLVVERGPFGRLLERLPSFLQVSYVWLSVGLGWVLFRAESLPEAISFYGVLLTGGASPQVTAASLLTAERLAFLVLAAILSFPVITHIQSSFNHLTNRISVDYGTGRAAILTTSQQIVVAFFGVTLLLYCAMRLAALSYNPFIYFRF